MFDNPYLIGLVIKERRRDLLAAAARARAPEPRSARSRPGRLRGAWARMAWAAAGKMIALGGRIQARYGCRDDERPAGTRARSAAC